MLVVVQPHDVTTVAIFSVLELTFTREYVIGVDVPCFTCRKSCTVLGCTSKSLLTVGGGSPVGAVGSVKYSRTDRTDPAAQRIETTTRSVSLRLGRGCVLGESICLNPSLAGYEENRSRDNVVGDWWLLNKLQVVHVLFLHLMPAPNEKVTLLPSQ